MVDFYVTEYHYYDDAYQPDLLIDRISSGLVELLGEGWTFEKLDPGAGTTRYYTYIYNPEYNIYFYVLWLNQSSYPSMRINAYYQGYQLSPYIINIGDVMLNYVQSKPVTIAVFKNNNGDFAVKMYDNSLDIIQFYNLIVKDKRGKDVCFWFEQSQSTAIHYAFDGSRGFQQYIPQVSDDMYNSGAELVSRANDALWGGYLSDVYQIINYQSTVNTATQIINGVEFRLIGRYTGKRALLAVPND